VQSWQTDDLWIGLWRRSRVYVRAAADRSDRSVEAICGRIASERGITVAGDDSGYNQSP
jgi:hypothetical protein